MVDSINHINMSGVQSGENLQDKTELQTAPNSDILKHLDNRPTLLNEMAKKAEKFKDGGQEFIRQTLAPPLSDLNPGLVNKLAVGAMILTPLTIPAGSLALGLAKIINSGLEKAGLNKINEQHFTLAGLLIGSLGILSISLLAKQLVKHFGPSPSSVDVNQRKAEKRAEWKDRMAVGNKNREELLTNINKQRKAEKSAEWKDRMAVGNKNREELLTNIHKRQAIQAQYDEIFDFFENQTGIKKSETPKEETPKEETASEVPVARTLTDLKATLRENIEDITLVDLIASKYNAVIHAFQQEGNQGGVNSDVMSKKLDDLNKYTETALPEENFTLESTVEGLKEPPKTDVMEKLEIYQNKKAEWKAFIAERNELRDTAVGKANEKAEWKNFIAERNKLRDTAINKANKKTEWENFIAQRNELRNAAIGKVSLETQNEEVKSKPSNEDIQKIKDEIWDELTDEERKTLGNF